MHALDQSSGSRDANGQRHIGEAEQSLQRLFVPKNTSDFDVHTCCTAPLITSKSIPFKKSLSHVIWKTSATREWHDFDCIDSRQSVSAVVIAASSTTQK
jgi:hypothetical protein